MDAGVKSYRQTRDRESRDRLIVSHLGFVKHVLGKMLIEYPATVDAENLEAAGVLGLVEAAGRFSPETGVDFKTFAYQRIRGAILDELRRNCPLPQQILQHWSQIRNVMRSTSTSCSISEIADRTNLSVEEVEKCLVAVRMANPETWSEDLTPSVDNQPTSTDPVIQQEQQSRVREAVEQLPEQQRLVITLYHLDDLTLKQIGTVLELSESRVSRILATAEFQLKQQVQRRTSVDPSSSFGNQLSRRTS